MLARAIAGTAIEGDWLVAARQTAGRGRQGREWQSPLGNLYASCLVTIGPNDPLVPTLALVAGVALCDAVATPLARLKWPNDLLIEGAKLAGILLERTGEHVVVGIGINLAYHPALTDRTTTSLAHRGDFRTPAELLDPLAHHFAHWLRIWRDQRLAAICAAWAERAHPVGTPLSAMRPDGDRIDGIFEGLTEDGALAMRLASGERHVIHAGDVFLV